MKDEIKTEIIKTERAIKKCALQQLTIQSIVKMTNEKDIDKINDLYESFEYLVEKQRKNVEYLHELLLRNKK